MLVSWMNELALKGTQMSCGVLKERKGLLIKQIKLHWKKENALFYFISLLLCSSYFFLLLAWYDIWEREGERDSFTEPRKKEEGITYYIGPIWFFLSYYYGENILLVTWCFGLCTSLVSTILYHYVWVSFYTSTNA